VASGCSEPRARLRAASSAFAGSAPNTAISSRSDVAAIVRAMRILFERMKQVVEPSAAVPLACLLERTVDVGGKRVGIIVSGGNVDLDRLPWQSQ
jgi:threonine dehydratase